MGNQKAIGSTGLRHEKFPSNVMSISTNNKSLNQNLSRSKGRIQTYRTLKTVPLLDPQQQQQQHQNQRRTRATRAPLPLPFQFPFHFHPKILQLHSNHDAQVGLNESKADT